MRIAIICTVRDITEERKKQQDAYVARLEGNGHEVFYPPRDTDQAGRGIDICFNNGLNIAQADVVHMIYNVTSQGTHFDLGMADIFGKPVEIPYAERWCKQFKLSREPIFNLSKRSIRVAYRGQRGNQSFHYDLGRAFALGRDIRVIDNEVFGEGKSFARMLIEWEAEGSPFKGYWD